MTREEIEFAIKCCNPYEEKCYECPFRGFSRGRCFEKLAKVSFNMLLDDRERLQKQVEKLLREIKYEDLH